MTANPAPPRLLALRVQGFKSFAEPTTFQLPGKLVGVVGPNGCGKSNIMDAVRWVLGEQSARALRGRRPDEVPHLLRDSLLAHGVGAEQVIQAGVDHRGGGQVHAQKVGALTKSQLTAFLDSHL